MKLYRVNYYSVCNTDTATEWASSQKAADKIARDNRCGDYEATITPVEVPTDRAGLIAFLNDNIFTHPNATRPWS
jgi:hypothetical protein